MKNTQPYSCLVLFLLILSFAGQSLATVAHEANDFKLEKDLLTQHKIFLPESSNHSSPVENLPAALDAIQKQVDITASLKYSIHALSMLNSLQLPTVHPGKATECNDVFVSTHCSPNYVLATVCANDVFKSTFCPTPEGDKELNPTYCAIITSTNCPDKLQSTICYNDDGPADFTPTYCPLRGDPMTTNCPDAISIPTKCPFDEIKTALTQCAEADLTDVATKCPDGTMAATHCTMEDGSTQTIATYCPNWLVWPTHCLYEDTGAGDNLYIVTYCPDNEIIPTECPYGSPEQFAATQCNDEIYENFPTHCPDGQTIPTHCPFDESLPTVCPWDSFCLP